MSCAVEVLGCYCQEQAQSSSRNDVTKIGETMSDSFELNSVVHAIL